MFIKSNKAVPTTFYFVLFLRIFSFISLFAFSNFDGYHEGILLKQAIDIVHRKILFRDTFTQYGALFTFIQAFAIKVFGEYLIVIRLTTVFFYAVLSVLLWLIWSMFLPKRLTAVALILWLALAPFYQEILLSWSSVYALVFQSASFLFLLAFCEKKKISHLFLAGAASSLVFWCRQPVGIFMFISMVTFVIILPLFKIVSFKKSFSTIASSTLGFVVVSAPFIIYIYKNQALKDWWLQSFVLAKVWAKEVRGISFDQLLKSLSAAKYWKQIHLYFIWLLLPLSIVYLTFDNLKKLSIKKLALKSAPVKLLAVSLLCLASWMQYYPMTDPSHFFWAVTPMVGFFIYLINGFFRRNKFLKSFGMKIVTTFIIAGFFYRLIPGVSRLKNATVYSDKLSYLRFIKLYIKEKEMIDNFSNKLSSYLSRNQTYINTSPDASVSLYLPSFHQISPFYFHWPFVSEKVYQDFIPKVRQYVNANHPVIVTRYGPFFSDYCSVSDVSYFDHYIKVYIWKPNILDIERVSKNVVRVRFKTDGLLKKIIIQKDIDIYSLMRSVSTDSSDPYQKSQLLPLNFNSSTQIFIPLTPDFDFKKEEVKLILDTSEIKNCNLIYQ